VVAAFRAFARFASIATILLGLLVLTGWAMGNRAMISVRSGLAAMAPLTAMSFVIAGCSLAVRHAGQHRAASILAAALPVMALVVLASHLAVGYDARPEPGA
jgi:hypothetical protein